MVFNPNPTPAEMDLVVSASILKELALADLLNRRLFRFPVDCISKANCPDSSILLLGARYLFAHESASDMFLTFVAPICRTWLRWSW